MGNSVWDDDTNLFNPQPDPSKPKQERPPLAILTNDGVEYYDANGKVEEPKAEPKAEKPADRYEGWSPDGPRYKVEYDEEMGMFDTPVNPYYQDEQAKRKFKGRMDEDGFIVFDEVDDKGNVINVAPTSLDDPPKPPTPAAAEAPAPTPAAAEAPAPADPYEGWSEDDPKYKMRMDEETGLFVFDKNPYVEEPEHHFKGRMDEETGLVVFDEVDEQGNVIREAPTSLDDDDDDDDEEEEEQEEEGQEEEEEEEEDSLKADSGKIEEKKENKSESSQNEQNKERLGDSKRILELL
jgi:hypothetical protein